MFGPSLEMVVLVLGLTSWTTMARLVRAESAALRGRPFLLAAEALGAGPLHRLRRHLLPSVLPPALAAAPVVFAGAVTAEAALGFIGLGDARAVSLGRLIADAYPFFAEAWWMSVAPGAALAVIVLAVHGLAEALARPD